MKKKIQILLVVLTIVSFISYSFVLPSSVSGCKIVLDGEVISEVSVEKLLQWCESTPPVIQCENGKLYKLKYFNVSFFTLKPLMNRDFGVGEGGIPIRAVQAVEKGMTGDALVLKNIQAIATDGTEIKIEVLSIKIN